MSKIPPTTGRFVWHELVTQDVKAAVAFYSELFGWKPTEMDMGPGGGKYTMLRADGRDVGGIVPAEKAKGIPPHWNPYCTVKDVDAAAQRAKALGGTVMMPATDIPNIGRFAVLCDKEGATLSAFRPKEDSAEQEGLPPNGTFCWTELLAKDPKAAAAFYKEIFAWSVVETDMGPMGTYYRMDRGGKMSGGIPKSPMPEAPSCWLSYVAVEDVDQSLKRALSLKAKVVAPAADIPGIGRFAVLADPTGAVFALFRGVAH